MTFRWNGVVLCAKHFTAKPSFIFHSVAVGAPFFVLHRVATSKLHLSHSLSCATDRLQRILLSMRQGIECPFFVSARHTQSLVKYVIFLFLKPCSGVGFNSQSDQQLSPPIYRHDDHVQIKSATAQGLQHPQIRHPTQMSSTPIPPTRHPFH